MTLRIGLSLSPTWLRGDGWRRADSRVEQLYSGGFFVEAARIAEAAHVDFLLKPDALVLDREALSSWPGFGSPDPTVLMAALAAETERIGLVTTVSTTFVPPFQIARQVQSLHQLSAGRAGWNVVTSLDGDALHGTAPDDGVPGAGAAGSDSAARYARAHEAIDLVRRLWRSYPAEAVLADRTTGRYVDAALLRPVAHRGGQLAVAGMNTLPQHPAGPPPILQAGGSEAGRELAARTADAVFAMAPDVASAVSQRADLHARAVRAGRRPGDLRVLPGVSLFLARTAAAARELAAGSRSTAGGGRGASHWSIVGTPAEAAREIADWAGAGALDGFIALPGGSWGSLRLFGEDLMPRLVDLGLARASYTGSTLAAHLGLPGR
ncbi:LLM class flavin-dependent oxidoreductase [Microbacterium marinilacus]|uniref:Luciferase-like domain-containing protein n=1 Tax=Microbacterium marinilacus TaxID=415209 RepID=A0ABP7BRK4_9MICO|nr:LLM class flavin-dependent oxidoreductase [Microbacterium marinilacus]MBY0689164.1 LLM class flavin-dependent oxidoreductase [Microbacterium marinilacus]